MRERSRVLHIFHRVAAVDILKAHVTDPNIGIIGRGQTASLLWTLDAKLPRAVFDVAVHVGSPWQTIRIIQFAAIGSAYSAFGSSWIVDPLHESAATGQNGIS